MFYPFSLSDSASVPSVSGIYIIFNSESCSYYIGSSGNIHVRMRQHIRALERQSHHSRYLQRSYNRHGSDVFIFGILEVVDDTADLLVREQHWLDTSSATYNVSPTAGSNRGTTLSAETRAKLSEITKAQWRAGIHSNSRVVSKETRAKLSEATASNWQSKSHRERMREAARNRFLQAPNASENIRRAKISAFHKEHWKTRDRTVSEEQRAKISKTLTGKPQPWNSRARSEEEKEKQRNRVFSDETRRKMSEAKLGRTLPPEHAEKIKESNRQRRAAKEAARLAKEQALLARWENIDPLEPIDPAGYAPLTLWSDTDFNA